MKNLLLKLTLLLCLFPSAFAQVTISGTQEVASGQTHTITLTANQTVTGISVVGSGTTLVINGAFTLTNSDSTNGTVLNGGVMRGSGTLSTGSFNTSNSGSLDISSLIITGTQTDQIDFGNGANTLTLSGGGNGLISMGGGNDTLIVSSVYSGTLDGGVGTDILRLDGGTVSGSLATFETLDVTSNGGVLNSNLSVRNVTLAGNLTGTGNLTIEGGNITAGAGQLNISGTLTSSWQNNDITLGDNVTTVNLHLLIGITSYTNPEEEGDITLGSGATNATVTVIGQLNSQTYSGDLTGSGDDNLSLNNLTYTGTATGFDSLAISNNVTLNANLGSASERVALTMNANATNLNIASGKTFYASTINFLATDNIQREISSAGTINISGTITNSSGNRRLYVATVILTGNASGNIRNGATASTTVIDGISYSDIITGGVGSDLTLQNGATFAGSFSTLRNFTVGSGTNILDTNLSPSGSTTINGTLQIASGHSLTTASGQTNQVASGGTLDISQVTSGYASIKGAGITIVGGGTLAVGTAKNRNASNITLTRGASASTSSAISIDLGTLASTSTTPIFSTLPPLTGTGTVALNITGSLASGATQRVFTGVNLLATGNYRIGFGSFELAFEGGNTIIRERRIVLNSTTASLTGRGVNNNGDLTNGTIGVNVVVEGTFNNSNANLHTLGNITVEAGATVGSIRGNNITVTSATVGALQINGDGTLTITQNDNGATGGNLSLGGALTGSGASTLRMTNNDSNSVIVVNSSSNRISGFVNLVLSGTGQFTLNSNLTITGNTTLNASLGGTGHLTTGTISGSGAINIAQTTITGSQTNHLGFGTGVNTVTLSGGGSGNINLGLGNDTVIVRSTYTGILSGQSGTDTLRLVEATVSGSTIAFENLEVGEGISVLDTNLTLTGDVTIQGTLQIATGHRLSVSSSSTNQVVSGGALDISQIVDLTNPIAGSGGITIVGGGTLALGTAKRRVGSRFTLTRGADSSTSSAVSIDLGRRATGSSTPIFSTLPTLTGTGTVALNITGSLINESTQVFASGDVTAAYRTSGAFELSFNGTNTLIEFTGIGGVDLVGVTGATSRVLKVQTALAQLQEEASLISVAGLALLDRISLLEPVAVARELSQLIPTQAVSVATSGVTTTATTTNSIIATRTISVATGKSTGAKGPDQESKLAGVNIWFDFGLSFGGLDSDGESRGYDFSSYATRFGIDKRYSKTVLGFAFGYTTTTLENDGIAGDNDLTTLSFSFYGSYTGNEKYRIDLQTSLAINDIKVSGANSGSTDGTLLDIDTSVHYTAGKSFTSFVGLRLIFNDFASYTLRGALPINVEGESYSSLFIKFGTRWDRGWKTKTYRHNVGLKSSFHYNLLDTQRDTTAVFVGGTEPFEVRGVEEDKSGFILGVDYALRRAKLTYLFSYDLAFGSSSSSHRLSLKANYKF